MPTSSYRFVRSVRGQLAVDVARIHILQIVKMSGKDLLHASAPYLVKNGNSVGGKGVRWCWQREFFNTRSNCSGTRMSYEDCEEWFGIIATQTSRKDANFRMAISAKERLLVQTEA